MIRYPDAGSIRERARKWIRSITRRTSNAGDPVERPRRLHAPIETSQQPLYRLLGTPDADKAHKLYDGGHVFPFSRMIKDSLDWRDKYLGAPR